RRSSARSGCFVEVASAQVVRRNLPERWNFHATARHGVRATRMEMTPGRRVQRAGDFPFDRVITGTANIETRDLRQQRLGIGMIGAT
nr:hypothetical protein [Tanacetum cinerariifolium]